MKAIIIGAGNLGLTLAEHLLEIKYDIAIIELNPERANLVANKSNALVIRGDASDESILRDAGAHEANAIIVLTNDDKVNLMVCELAKNMSKATVISRVNHPDKEALFKKLGISLLVPIVSMSVNKIMGYLEERAEFVGTVDDGNMQLFKLSVKHHSPLVGKPPAIKKAMIICIFREGNIFHASEIEDCKPGDEVLVSVKTDEVPGFIKD